LSRFSRKAYVRDAPSDDDLHPASRTMIRGKYSRLYHPTRGIIERKGRVHGCTSLDRALTARLPTRNLPAIHPQTANMTSKSVDPRVAQISVCRPSPPSDFRIDTPAPWMRLNNIRRVHRRDWAHRQETPAAGRACSAERVPNVSQRRTNYETSCSQSEPRPQTTYLSNTQALWGLRHAHSAHTRPRQLQH
jgi:hypothetical protein